MSLEAKVFLALLGLLAVLAVVVLLMGVGGGDGGYEPQALEERAAWLREWAESAARGELGADDVAERSGCPPGEGAGILVIPHGRDCRLVFAESKRPVRRGDVVLERGAALRLRLDQERFVPLDLTLGRGAARTVDVTRSGARLVLTCLQGEARQDDRRDDDRVCRVRLRPARS